MEGEVHIGDGEYDFGIAVGDYLDNQVLGAINEPEQLKTK